MSLARRLRLLEWASRSNAWIVDDDYDGEFRYTGKPMTRETRTTIVLVCTT